tara:strand:- start:1695 stop:2306 length:612 start_codon:yes stop_codon:yes gene_type:complete
MLSDGYYINPWSTLIYKTSYDFNYPQIKPSIQKFINKRPANTSALEKGEAWSSVGWQYNPPHLWEEFKDFGSHLLLLLKEIYQANRILDKENCLLQSWLNTHGKGGETLEHSHNLVDFVVTSYLNLPENGGFIEFRDPLEYHKANSYINAEEELWKPVHCTTNDVIIFPGWLKHRVQPNQSDEERVVMTINVGSPNAIQKMQA